MATHTLTTGDQPCLQPFCDGLANRLTRAAETPTGTTAWSEAIGCGGHENQRVSSVCPSGLKESSVLVANGNFGTINRLQRSSAVCHPEDTGNQTAMARCASSYNIGQRWKSATLSSNTTTYSYDDADRPKTKDWRAVASVYVYDRESALAGKYNSAAGSKYSNPASIIPRQDHPPGGSEIAPAIVARPHSYPGADAVSPRFTGKERDAETGLDYFGARYFSGAQGRFTSPDAPFADQHTDDPQSWNLYAYTRNNPLRYIDDDGRGAKEFLFGMFNATTSNSVGGLGRANSSDPSIRYGQKVGDVISMAGSMVEMAVGGGAATGGGALCLTGVGCLGGAPAIVAGGALAAHGATQMGTAAANFMMSSSGSSSSGSPDFVVSEGGDAIPVPQGSSGPTPVVNPQGKVTGSADTGGSGGKGLDPKVTTVRIMDQTAPKGSSPGYPNGYVTYQNKTGQGVNPQTGKTVPNSDPTRHLPLSPKPCPGGGTSCP